MARLEIAATAWRRAVGLLGHTPLAPEEGLWLAPCNGIHTLGMRFALDVLFLDSVGRALHMAADVAPWRFRGPVLGARVVVELAAGTLDRTGIQVGYHYRRVSIP